MRLPPRRFGPSVRLASKASTRNRFGLFVAVTVVISIIWGFAESRQKTGAGSSALLVPNQEM
jgi:hypothetical protein